MSDDTGFQFFQQAMAAFDTPAFMRRARDAEVAWEFLLDRCRQKREKLLEFPRLRVAKFFKSLSDSTEVHPQICSPQDLAYLSDLYQVWSPRLQIAVPVVQSERQLKRLLSELRESFESFNRKWTRHITEIDLTEINKLRDKYNKYYVLEKECAVRSTAVAVSGFVPLAPVTTDDLFETFPLLKVPGSETE